MIKRCTCKHKEQDKLHGKGKRVWNRTAKKPNGQGGIRCTVCGREEEKK